MFQLTGGSDCPRKYFHSLPSTIGNSGAGGSHTPVAWLHIRGGVHPSVPAHTPWLHRSSPVQAIPSSHVFKSSLVPTQTPPTQTSSVQSLPSEQGLLSSATFVHSPVSTSHVSSVQGLPSSQSASLSQPVVYVTDSSGRYETVVDSEDCTRSPSVPVVIKITHP